LLVISDRRQARQPLRQVVEAVRRRLPLVPAFARRILTPEERHALRDLVAVGHCFGRS
jgi:hypothetical protein